MEKTFPSIWRRDLARPTTGSGIPWRPFTFEARFAHRWRPEVTDGVVTTFVRGSSTSAPPFPEPSRGEALFCAGWYLPDSRGRQMRNGHAALWVYGEGILRLFLASPENKVTRGAVVPVYGKA